MSLGERNPSVTLGDLDLGILSKEQAIAIDLMILESKHKELAKKNDDLANNNAALSEELAKLTKSNTVLKSNISTLYKTARAEIERKNQRIADMQAEIDCLIFKRRRTNG